MMLGTASKMSMRRQLLLGILLPLLILVGINAWSLYQEALNASDIAYDRSLLASAKTISEQLDVVGYDNDAQIRALVPYAATEAFESDNQSRLYYKVSHLNGTMVSGFSELPVWKGQIPAKPAYAALVDFYNDTYQGEEIRVATLLQPVVSEKGRAMAVIQVAETLELRHTLARELLIGTLWRQALLLGIIALVVVSVVQRATQPVRKLSEHLENRSEHDLAPLAFEAAPQEIQASDFGHQPCDAKVAILVGAAKRICSRCSASTQNTSGRLETSGAICAAWRYAQRTITARHCTDH